MADGPNRNRLLLLQNKLNQDFENHHRKQTHAKFRWVERYGYQF